MSALGVLDSPYDSLIELLNFPEKLHKRLISNIMSISISYKDPIAYANPFCNDLITVTFGSILMKMGF